MDDPASTGQRQALVTEFLARRIAGVQPGDEARLAAIEGELDAWLRLNGLAHLRAVLHGQVAARRMQLRAGTDLLHSAVARQLAEVGPGEHLCLIYETETEQLAAAVPFVQLGLARDECCVYFADEATAGRVRGALAGAGVDVAQAERRGALRLVGERTYLVDGRFEPPAVLASLRQTVDEALAAGFSGWRATGDMTWELGPVSGVEVLPAYEAHLDAAFRGRRMVGMCQYHRRRVPPAIIHHALRTHRTVVLGDQVCPNPYYEPPEVVQAGDDEGQRVDWMLAQLLAGRPSQAHG